MKLLFSFVLFAASLFFTACNNKTKDDPLLVEARKVHNEAVKIHNEVMKDLKEVKKMKTEAEAKLKDLDEKAKDDKTRLEELIKQCDTHRMAMSAWMKDLQEVPGNDDHDHHDHEGHDHNHDHKPAPQVSPQQMLDYQKEMKKNIEKLQQDVKALLKK
jgi:ABC-type nickel/cobalt efflux system permease component RcnA